MSERVRASDIYRIEREDILRALDFYDGGEVAHRFVESTRFDMLIDGFRRYPPKAVVGLAAERAFERILGPNVIPMDTDRNER